MLKEPCKAVAVGVWGLKNETNRTTEHHPSKISNEKLNISLFFTISESFILL